MLNFRKFQKLGWINLNIKCKSYKINKKTEKKKKKERKKYKRTSGTLSAQNRSRPVAHLLSTPNWYRYLSLSCWQWDLLVITHLQPKLPRRPSPRQSNSSPLNSRWFPSWFDATPCLQIVLPLLSISPLHSLWITPPGHLNLSPEPAGTNGHFRPNLVPPVSLRPPPSPRLLLLIRRFFWCFWSAQFCSRSS
jgi:hypothetical protein